MSKRICLGKISSAHGVKGFVKVKPYGEDVTLIETLGPAFLSETGDKSLQVRIKSSAGQLMLCSIDGVADRDEAQALRGTELWFDRALLPDLDEDDGIYHADLVGMRVVEGDEKVGLVIAVDNFGAGDLLEIKSKAGAEFYLPYVDDHIVDVDLEARTVFVRNHKDMIIG